MRGALATPDGSPPHWLRYARMGCGAVVLAVAISVIAGWFAGATGLTSYGGHNDMRPGGALLAGLAGVTLLINPEPLEPRSRTATVLVGILMLGGILGLLQALFGVSFGASWLFSAHPRAGEALYASPQSSLEMVFFAVAQLGPKTRRFSWIRGIAMVLFLVIALTFSVALVFGAEDLVEQGGQPGINRPGSVVMMTLSVGLTVVKARSSPMRWMWHPTLTGTLVRRLLPSMAVLPMALTCMTVIGQRLGWFDIELGIALLTVLITAVGVSIVAITAAVVHRAERRANGAAEYSQALLNSAPDATIVVDDKGAIRYANERTRTLLGYDPSELIGQPVELLVPDRIRPRHPRLRNVYSAAPTLRSMGAGLELTARHRDGREIPVEISLGPVHTDDGTIQVAALRDVTEKRAAQRALREAQERYRLLAEQDELTGLSNRRRFEADMESHLGLDGPSTGALLFIDLDHFKTVNDTLGHPAGDQLLILVAGAMAEVLPEHALIARRGGDEFLVLLREGSGAEAERHARALVATVPQVARQFDSTATRVSASAGIAVFDEFAPHERRCATAMNRADLALYAAKAAGRNQTHRWTPSDVPSPGTFGRPSTL
jgi:diguanylate cyclase (GGDEF)-like protein/PAS domain S-box-containing protein